MAVPQAFDALPIIFENRFPGRANDSKVLVEVRGKNSELRPKNEWRATKNYSPQRHRNTEKRKHLEVVKKLPVFIIIFFFSVFSVLCGEFFLLLIFLFFRSYLGLADDLLLDVAGHHVVKC